MTAVPRRLLDPRRRTGRRRDGPGRAPPRRRGRARRRRRARAPQRAGAAGRGARRGPASRRHRARARRAARPARAATATTTSSSSTTAASCGATACSSRPVAVRGSRASGSRPSASTPDAHGIPVDAQLRAGDGLWAIGDVTGIWPLTTTGKYQGDIVAANILGEPREANYDALPRVVFTDPQAAAVGALEARFTGQRAGLRRREDRHLHPRLRRVERLPDPAQRRRPLTGAYALGPEAGEWLQQATLAIRAHVPLDVLRDTIQPFPTFSEIYADALEGAPRRDRRRERVIDVAATAQPRSKGLRHALRHRTRRHVPRLRAPRSHRTSPAS